MNRAAILFFVLVFVTVFGDEPPAFTFKGNNLGMTLEKFKQQNAGDPVWVVFRDPNQKNKKVKKQLPTPVCTDTNDGAFSFRSFYDYSLSDWKSSEILCDVSPGVINGYQRLVAD